MYDVQNKALKVDFFLYAWRFWPWCPTVDDHCGCGAASFSNDVAGNARVVPRIGEASFRDDKAVVTSQIEDAVISIV